MKLITALLFVCMVGCKPKPEFEINGKQYYTRNRCIKDHREPETGYHYGFYSGMYTDYEGHIKFGFHAGFHWPYQCFGACRKTVCDKSVIDTLEIH